MQQKLYALKYIRNNKKRVATLVVSLTLYFVLMYITDFLLAVTEETFRPVFLENTKKIQYYMPVGSTLGIDHESMSDEEFYGQYGEKTDELAKKLMENSKIKAVYNSFVVWNLLTPPIGQMTNEIPLVSKEDVPTILEHMDAELTEGRLPENEGEIVMDAMSMKNGGYSLGDGLSSHDEYEDYYKIVGVIECDTYFACGIRNPDFSSLSMLIILSEGVTSLTDELAKAGVTVQEGLDEVVDLESGKEMFKKDVVDVIASSTRIVYTGIPILLCIALLIVYTTYLRDRHNEWCLYCSIGYSRKTIYFSILRELLFTFVLSVAAGLVLSAATAVILDAVMLSPMGVRSRYISIDTVGSILCTYALLFAVLQLPVRYALYRIRTVDALEDDLY